jgi:hypothetical protein
MMAGFFFLLCVVGQADHFGDLHICKLLMVPVLFISGTLIL